jgi:HEAT repeat protein
MMLSELILHHAIDQLNDPSYHVRLRAVAALERWPDPRAIPALLHALGDFDTHDEASKVNWAASVALSRIGAVALRPLIAALHPQPAHPHDGWRRYWTARTLGFFPEPHAVEALIAVLADSEREVVEGAVEALRRIAPPEALAPLRHLLITRPFNGGYVYTAICNVIEAIETQTTDETQSVRCILRYKEIDEESFT